MERRSQVLNVDYESCSLTETHLPTIENLIKYFLQLKKLLPYVNEHDIPMNFAIKLHIVWKKTANTNYSH